MYFEWKMKRKIKLNSEYLLSFATLKKNKLENENILSDTA